MGSIELIIIGYFIFITIVSTSLLKGIHKQLIKLNKNIEQQGNVKNDTHY